MPHIPEGYRVSQLKCYDYCMEAHKRHAATLSILPLYLCMHVHVVCVEVQVVCTKVEVVCVEVHVMCTEVGVVCV